MADMVLHPAYPDVDSERQVVIEEIAMYEDEPSDKVHDVLAEAVFGDHPLGRPVIGAAEVISSVAVPQIAAYHDSRYVAENLVVSAAGSVEHDRLVALVEEGLRPPQADGDSGLPGPVSERRLEGFSPTPAASQPSARFHEKATEQYHLCLGAPGLARADERRFALRVLDTLFGGSPSSRLFQEVREKRGLAYSVFSYSSQYVDTGEVALYVGTRPGNLRAAAEVLADELRKLQDGSVSEQELERAKEGVKGRTALSMESTLSRMNRLGTSVLMGVPVMSLDEIVAAIDAVTLGDIEALVRELLPPERLSAAGVGDDEDAFRNALEAVNPALAGA
jgi:predicted Zn-dependent peptidase